MQPVQDIATLYTDFRGSIYRYLRRLTQDDGLAEDLTQETFLRADKHLHTFRGEGSIENWLYRIATTLCRDSLRTRSGKHQSWKERSNHFSERIAKLTPVSSHSPMKSRACAS